jgi:hypothetical protein
MSTEFFADGSALCTKCGHTVKGTLCKHCSKPIRQATKAEKDSVNSNKTTEWKHLETNLWKCFSQTPSGVTYFAEPDNKPIPAPTPAPKLLTIEKYNWVNGVDVVARVYRGKDQIGRILDGTVGLRFMPVSFSSLSCEEMIEVLDWMVDFGNPAEPAPESETESETESESETAVATATEFVPEDKPTSKVMPTIYSDGSACMTCNNIYVHSQVCAQGKWEKKKKKGKKSIPVQGTSTYVHCFSCKEVFSLSTVPATVKVYCSKCWAKKSKD